MKLTLALSCTLGLFATFYDTTEAAAMKDPKTLEVLSDLRDFCRAQKGETKGCFAIRMQFQQATFAKAAKANPCGRVRAANALLAKFPNAADVQDVAKRMSTAPINVIPGLQKKAAKLSARSPKKDKKNKKNKKDKKNKKSKGNKRVGKGVEVQCTEVKFNGN